MTDLKALANNVLSRNKGVPKGVGQGDGKGLGLGQASRRVRQESDRIHTIVLLGEPYPDEPDNDDPDEGKRIIAAVESAGGWLRLWEGRIVLRWTGHMPDTGAIIDRIRANRIGVVAALTESHAAGL